MTTEAVVRTCRILLVEDEPDVGVYFRDLLSERGMTVTWAGTIHEGAAAALRQPVDIAVVDERLPDGRGTALIRWLHRRFPGMKLMVFSAFADWNMFFRASEYGAVDVLSKSRPANEVVRAIEACVP